MTAFGQILDAALGANLEQQIRLARIELELGTSNWLKEFGTVRICLGRQSGKTTAIQRRASSRDLVVVHSHAMAKDFSEYASFNPTVITPRNLENPMLKLREMRFDRIWVDNASWILKGDDLGNVYKNAMLNGAKQIILVG